MPLNKIRSDQSTPYGDQFTITSMDTPLRGEKGADRRGPVAAEGETPPQPIIIRAPFHGFWACSAEFCSIIRGSPAANHPLHTTTLGVPLLLLLDTRTLP